MSKVFYDHLVIFGELEISIKNVAQSKEEFINLNDHIRQILNVPHNRAKSWFTKGLNLIIPRRFYSKLPNSLVKMIAEEFDALEAGEGKYFPKTSPEGLAGFP